MSLHLDRKIGQKVIIDGDITVTVTKVEHRRVTLSFDFPKSKTVYREELVEKAIANGTQESLPS